MVKFLWLDFPSPTALVGFGFAVVLLAGAHLLFGLSDGGYFPGWVMFGVDRSRPILFRICIATYVMGMLFGATMMFVGSQAMAN